VRWPPEAEPAAQFADRVRRRVGEGEAGQPLAGPGDEQPNGITGRDLCRACGDRGTVKRWDSPAHLARYVEHYPAGDEDAQVRGAGQQLACEHGDFVPMVLRAVDQQQPGSPE